LGDQGDRRRHVIRLAHHIDLAAELRPDPRAEQAVIVDDKDPRPGATGGGHGHARAGRLGWRFPASRGIASDTSVPSPGALRTGTEPPWRGTRGRGGAARTLP